MAAALLGWHHIAIASNDGDLHRSPVLSFALSDSAVFWARFATTLVAYANLVSAPAKIHSHCSPAVAASIAGAQVDCMCARGQDLGRKTRHLAVSQCSDGHYMVQAIGWHLDLQEAAGVLHGSLSLSIPMYWYTWGPQAKSLRFSVGWYFSSMGSQGATMGWKDWRWPKWVVLE